MFELVIVTTLHGAVQLVTRVTVVLRATDRLSVGCPEHEIVTLEAPGLLPSAGLVARIDTRRVPLGKLNVPVVIVLLRKPMLLLLKPPNALE